MATPSLADLTAFATVASHRSFRKAADALGSSRSALSHAIRSLEQDLGTRLLHRTTRSVAPTEAGERLLRRLVPALREFDDMLAATRGEPGEVVGTLRINANETAARWLLRHAVPEFQRRHPHVALDLVTDGRLVDIVAAGFDAGARLAEAVPQDMVAVPFGGEARFLAVAAPSYVAEHGRPITPDDLQHHRCIRQRLPSGSPYRWEFARQDREVAVEVPGTLTLDHNPLMAEAAADGLGIAFVPELVARQALENGSLVPLLEDWCPTIPGLCLYYPGHRHPPAALAAFVAVLRKARGHQATAS
jgi:DNA-binding transcriptional LysR family regulator